MNDSERGRSVRPAATVMLLRDAAPEIEVFMLRRSPESAFLPDAYVFPGGALEDGDLASSAQLQGIGDARLHEDCGLDARVQRGLFAAALREVSEECGVLLADVRPLVLFSHWVTPHSERRRYDVHFFLARIPPGQHPVADARETHDGIWITPKDALVRGDDGSLLLIYPTRKHLERIATFATVASLLDYARSKPILTVLAPLSPSLEGAW